MEKLLAWGIANSGDVQPDSDEVRRAPTLDPQLIAQLMGGKDDAQLMVEAMECISSPDETLENREIAFDNLEQLIENLDNANNMEKLNLWNPLIRQLSAPEPSIRFMAAWVCGTAVQNNRPAQETLHKINAAPHLVNVALTDDAKDVRGKAVYAISSFVRNYQDGMDQVWALLPSEVRGGKERIDAEDMEAIDAMRDTLKGEGSKKETMISGEMATAV